MAENPTGLTEAIDAVARGDVAALAALLRDNPALIEAADEDGDRLIHHAAARGQPAALRCLLLEFGADADSRGRWGRTPLHCAAASGAADAGATLLSNQADLDAVDAEGLTPLHHAILRRVGPHPGAMLGLLLMAGATLDLRAAVLLGMTHVVEVWLLRDPQAVRSSAARSDLLLDAAAWCNERRDLAEMLGRDRRLARTAERLAGQYRNGLRLVELLLQHGADPDGKLTGDPRTPRQRVEEWGHGALLKLFDAYRRPPG
jgi:ankyrin repeat protein